MGLLGFFSRKTSRVNVDNTNNNNPLLKSQPYNATVASLPPVRGTEPVVGNGPNILETLQKTHPRLNKAQDISFGAHSPASPPTPLRDVKLDRPYTAPSQDRHGWSAHGRLGSLTDHPVPSISRVPPPNNKQRLPYRLPDRELDQPVRHIKPGPPYRLPSKGYDQPVLEQPSFPFSRERSSSSIHSSRSGPVGGHVDLLDAHAGFYPTDFRLRIRAAGARDYGEDVADRNLGNSSSYVRPVDSRGSGATRNSSSRPTSSVPSATKEPGERIDSKPNKRHSLRSSLRTTSMASDVGIARPRSNRRQKEAESPLPKGRPRVSEDESEGASASNKAVWRKSMPSAMGSSRKRSEQDESPDFPESLRARGRAIPGTAETENCGRTSSTSQKPPHGEARVDMTTGSKAEVYVSTRKSSSKQTKDARRRTMIHVTDYQVIQKPLKRRSLQNLKLSVRRDNGTGDESLRVKPRSPTFETSAFRLHLGSSAVQDSPPTSESHMSAFNATQKSPPRHPAGRGRPTGEETANHQFHAPVSGRTGTSIDLNDIPERKSSIRKWSMDSTSATSLGSNPFRPQSRHTANTSLDLSPISKDTNFGHDLGATSHRTSPDGRLWSLPAITSVPSHPRSTHKPKLSTTFNMDDYISSDDDPDAPRHPRGDDEKPLLFEDTGFAFSGVGLPGISSSMGTTTPRIMPALPGPKNNNKFNDFTLEKYAQSRSEPRYSARQHRSRYQTLSHRCPDSDSSDLEEPEGLEEEEEEEEESEDELTFDIPMTRRSTPVHSYRPSRYASREHDIEEEREFEKIDLNTAMRSRKEEKRKKRKKRLSGASGSTIRSYSNSGKVAEVLRLRKYDAAGFDADIEPMG